MEFAELTGVPVVPTLMGWGAIPDDHPLTAGMVGLQTSHRYGNATMLGQRLRPRHRQPLGEPAHRRRGDLHAAGRTFVHVDIEPTQIGRVFAPDFGIVSDARAALELFVRGGAGAEGRRAAAGPRRVGRARAGSARRTMLRKTNFDKVPVKPQRVFQEMNKAFGPDTRYVSTIGLSQIQAAQMLHVYKPRHWINAGQAGPLGWTVPAALGVATADPEATVVALSGDYDFQFLIEELAVGAQFNIPYIHVLVNNSYLGLIRQSQRGFDMDYFVQLSFDNINSPEIGGYGVDHVKVAEGLGCKAIRVFEPDDDPAGPGGGEEADRRAPGAGRRRGDPGAGHQHLHGHRDRQRHRVRADRRGPRGRPHRGRARRLTAEGPAMPTVLVAPDKFKGSLTAAQVGAAVATGLRRGAAGRGGRTCCRWPTAVTGPSRPPSRPASRRAGDARPGRPVSRSSPATPAGTAPRSSRWPTCPGWCGCPLVARLP